MGSDVEVFRKGSDDGYETLPCAVRLHVVSIAMPNLNSSVRDAPTEVFNDQDAYRSTLGVRWRAALRAACAVGVTDLVCPDVGCGVYANDPNIMGEELGKILRAEFWGRLWGIWAVGNVDFRSALCAACLSSAAAGTHSTQMPGKPSESSSRTPKQTLRSSIVRSRRWHDLRVCTRPPGQDPGGTRKIARGKSLGKDSSAHTKSKLDRRSPIEVIDLEDSGPPAAARSRIRAKLPAASESRSCAEGSLKRSGGIVDEVTIRSRARPGR